MVKVPDLPTLPDVLRAADADLGAHDPDMLSVYLTKTEHQIVLHALLNLKGQSKGLAAGEVEALDSVIESFAENVESWGALKAMKL